MTSSCLRFFDQLVEIDDNNELSFSEKVRQLRISLEQCCKFLSKEDGIAFSNLFGRLEYICNKKQITLHRKGQLHEFRIFANKVVQGKIAASEVEYFRGLKVLAESYGRFFEVEVPFELKQRYDTREIQEAKSEKYHINPDGFRGMILDVNFDKKELTIQPDVAGDAPPVLVRFDIDGFNKEFSSSIELMEPRQQVQMLDTHRDKDGSVVPGMIILEPDYLLDVTSVAKCFQNIQGRKVRAFELFFIGRSEIRKLSKAIHKGNVANLFFDELLNEQPGSSKEFKEVLMRSFRTYSLSFTSLSDIDKSYFDQLEEQFNNLRRVVDSDFQKGDHRPVDRDKSNLEVFLMSPELGLQGRMDLFDETPSNNNHYASKIIELKSGKLPFPPDNPSVVAEDHSAQVRMYNMLAHRVLGYNPKKIFNAVLYSSSSMPGEAIRYVSHFKSIQREIINVRNQIVAWEYRLAADKEPYDLGHAFLQAIDVRKMGLNHADKRFSWFFGKFSEYKKLLLEKVSSLERQYYFAFSSFISREKILSKVGDGEYTKGLSALWNKNDLSDEDTFNELRDLRIKFNNAHREDSFITLSRPDKKQRFINFRRGDICVLYPYDRNRPLATQHRVLKCSIQYISNDEVTVHLRQKQSSLEYFNGYDIWVLEHDSLDNNFEQMHAGLFEFLKFPSARRELLMGLRPPARQTFDDREFVSADNSSSLEDSRKEQNIVLNKAWHASDYFLLVGPPGTGKTNLFLKRLVMELIKETDLNVLLVSYTNRAVDEMCSSVRKMVRDQMIRVGSSLGCDRMHEDLLLDQKIKGFQTRKKIRNLIEDTRLFAGTLSSLLGKTELFELKKFDIAIVDEASQILEPNIINLLGRVNRFVLIGDERQLPAVVTQSPAESQVTDKNLHKIGLFDRRNSYFERLLYLCKMNDWHHAWGELTFQGRMHPDLAAFSNKYFYNGKLKIAELNHQKEILFPDTFSENGDLDNILRQNRMVFIPSAFSTRETTEKSNHLEARVISEVVKSLIKLHHLSNADEVASKIGIITPYRNQIACIREQLEADGLDFFNHIQIDTVERFQGSQKDFILVSLCMNRPAQLDFLAQSRVFIDDKAGQGSVSQIIDRKLNVTLTRARKQLVITGNEAVLGGDEIYGHLIEDIRANGGYVKKGARYLVEG
jgi:DNA replication ATP-dependent helicase Dna2